jgi:hypothetical protein
MASNTASVNFNFYGLNLELRSEDSDLVESIERDFSYFKAVPGIPQVSINVFAEKPDFAPLPDLKASIYTLDYICYHMREQVFTDYHGKALRVFNTKQKNYRIFSDNADLRHEISYLTVLGTVGQFLDSRHIHRVHALGISRNGKAILVLLPEKGGKTTLALRLLKYGGAKLLSEDSPLITSHGEVLPFPLRLGILPGGEGDIPPKYIHPVNFMRVGTKLLVDVDYYADKISPPCQPSMVLLGERCLGCGAKIEPVGRLSAGKGFIKNAVIGLGLHQGMEYLLGRNLWETLGKGGLALSRLNNSLKVLRHSRVYRYVIGHDLERNNQVLFDFLQKVNL